MIAVDGIVKKITEVRPRIADAFFECQRCGAVIKEPQEGRVMVEPIECYPDQGGCGRKSHMKLLERKSVFVDSQKIQIMELPEGMRGQQPETITVYLEDDLAGTVYPGDRIIVNGILHGQQRSYGKSKLTEFYKVIDAVSIEHQDYAFEEVEVSPEDEALIRQYAGDPNIYKQFIKSIAPTIYGMEKEKEALMLQLFGGVPKKMPDGTRIRGDIHILLVGDPGTAKSQLLQYMSKLAPRSVYASGKSSTGAGLTVSAVRDAEFGEGKWVLEAGAMVLADLGIACIDEIEKMEAKERDALHQAMEQQEISVHKAGINTVLRTRCGVLAAANPTLGRFDACEPIPPQIGLTPALLTRFDMIFPITDVPDEVRDEKLAEHILYVHEIGEMDDGSTHESIDNIVPVLDSTLIRKYVSYARREVRPVLTPAAKEAIKDYYITLRRASSDEAVTITPRQIEAMIRMAEASARVRLSEMVTLDDAQRAINMMKYYMSVVAMDYETNKIDIDRITTGITGSKRGRILNLIDAVRRLEDEHGYADIELIKLWARENDVDMDTLEKDLRMLTRNGELYMPEDGRYKVIQ